MDKKKITVLSQLYLYSTDRNITNIPHFVTSHDYHSDAMRQEKGLEAQLERSAG